MVGQSSKHWFWPLFGDSIVDARLLFYLSMFTLMITLSGWQEPHGSSPFNKCLTNALYQHSAARSIEKKHSQPSSQVEFSWKSWSIFEVPLQVNLLQVQLFRDIRRPILQKRRSISDLTRSSPPRSRSFLAALQTLYPPLVASNQFKTWRQEIFSTLLKTNFYAKESFLLLCRLLETVAAQQWQCEPERPRDSQREQIHRYREPERARKSQREREQERTKERTSQREPERAREKKPENEPERKPLSLTLSGSPLLLLSAKENARDSQREQIFWGCCAASWNRICSCLLLWFILSPPRPPVTHIVGLMGNQKGSNTNFLSRKNLDFYFYLQQWEGSDKVKLAKISPSSSHPLSCQHCWLPPLLSRSHQIFTEPICHRSLPRKEKSVGRICLHDVVQSASTACSTVSVIRAIIEELFSLP